MAVLLVLSLGVVKISHSEDRIVYQKFKILDGNVSVTAKYYVFKGYPVNSSPYEFDLNISKGKNIYTIETILIARKSYKEAISDIRTGTGWKNGYLFVPSECGGGNAWRCNTEHVFSLRKGKLINIGEVGYGISKDNGPGSTYDNGYFYDYYDKFEINKLTSHASAPGIVMLMKEVDGIFVQDLSRTWDFNANRYKENKEIIEKYKKAKDGWQTEEYIRPLLGNAVLSKFCGKNTELEYILKQAEVTLDGERLILFMDIIRDIDSKNINRK